MQSPLLAPVRIIWRGLRTVTPIRNFVERRLLYPDLPYIQKQATYPSGPTLIAGFFSSVHGIGEAARLELEALHTNGVDAVGVDISSAFGLNDAPSPSSVVPREKAPIHGPLILHCNAPEAGRALQYLGKRLVANRHITGYWAWELETPPHDWYRAYKYCDALWVPSQHTARAFMDAPIPVTVKPHPVATPPDGGHSRTELGLPPSSEGSLLFLCMADGRSDLVRKNIRGAVRAFGCALGNTSGAILIVKLHHADGAGLELELLRKECAAYDNVHIVERLYSRSERNSLLHRCDVLLSLHRAEGYGLVLAEVLTLGKKVITTAYSGPLDFLHAENSEMIPYSMVPVQGDTLNYAEYRQAFWAAPDEKNAIQTICKIAGIH